MSGPRENAGLIRLLADRFQDFAVGLTAGAGGAPSAFAGQRAAFGRPVIDEAAATEVLPWPGRTGRYSSNGETADPTRVASAQNYLTGLVLGFAEVRAILLGLTQPQAAVDVGLVAQYFRMGRGLAVVLDELARMGPLRQEDFAAAFRGLFRAPGGSDIYPGRAAGSVGVQLPVFALGNGRFGVLDGTEDALGLFAGFSMNPARDGEALAVSLGPVMRGFEQLGAGELVISGPSPPAPVSSLPDGAWFRFVGVALDSKTLRLALGPVQKKGRGMSVKFNDKYHLVPDATSAQPQTAVAGEDLGANNVVYMKTADGKLYKWDGTEVAGVAVGVTDAVYLMGATATYYPPGTTLTTSVTLSIGETYAKEDATLVPASGLTAGNFTLYVGEAIGANTLNVDFNGPVFKA